MGFNHQNVHHQMGQMMVQQRQIDRTIQNIKQKDGAVGAVLYVPGIWPIFDQSLTKETEVREW